MVIAREPFPKDYETVKKIVEINNYQEVIQLRRSGCGGHNSEVHLDNHRADVYFSTRGSAGTIPRDIVTLEET